MKKEQVQGYLKKTVDNTIVGSIAALVVAFISIDNPGYGLIGPFYHLVKAVKKGIFEDEPNFQLEYEDELEKCLSDTLERMKIDTPEIADHYAINSRDSLIDVISNSEIGTKEGNEKLKNNLLNDSLGMDETEVLRISEFFLSAFQKSLFFYPRLNSYLLSIALSKVQDKINETSSALSVTVDQLNKTTKELSKYIKDEMVHKLRVWEHSDGMMHSFASLFKEFFLMRTPDMEVIKYLSRLQDEYNYDYAKYNSNPLGLSIESKREPFDLVERDVIYSEKEPLYECYLHFIEADYWYFNKRYVLAIEKYKMVRDDLESLNRTNENYNPNRINDAILYIVNSIAWSCHQAECYDQANINKEGVELFDCIFQGKDCYLENPFISIYRRNYGVCLEREKRYVDALKQYTIALSLLPDFTEQYKLFITYCSSLMKEWDRRYNKISKEWAKNVKYREHIDEWDISNNSIHTVKNYLSVAERIKGNFPDIYVQRAKMMTYELLFTKDIDKEQQYHAICEQLFFAKQFGGRQKGFKFVTRDFYFALYLICFRGQGNIWLGLCKECNSELVGEGDTNDFAQLLSEIKITRNT